MKLTFLGAANTVTGSKFLLATGKANILVDCGLFQGLKKLRLLNWAAFPVSPTAIDAVVLTHAHIDHSGYLPLLVKNGFNKKVLCTSGTASLCSILLKDSGYLHEEEARRANLYGYSKHSPALPLYSEQDAVQALKLLQPFDFEQDYEILPQHVIRFIRAGHIIGSSFVLFQHPRAKVLFSGDLGRQHHPMLLPPQIVKEADYLVLESTYGDELHDKTDPAKALAAIINRTIKRGGTVIIPAFAVGRTQDILFYLHQLRTKDLIPNVPVYVDSPMATETTKEFCSFTKEQKLDFETCVDVCRVAHYVSTPEASKKIDADGKPKIIVSASGMATGGRVLHHMSHFITDHKNTIIFTGFQAAGTRGEALVNGKTEIKIYGNVFPVKAEIASLKSMSAHADYEDTLQWLGHFKRPPRKVFLVHGDPDSLESLATKIKENLGWNCYIPAYKEEVVLK